MKKFLLAILISSMLVTGLAGCNAKPAVSTAGDNISTTSSTNSAMSSTTSSDTTSSADSSSSQSSTISATGPTGPTSATKSTGPTSATRSTSTTTGAIKPQGKTYTPAAKSLTGKVSFSGSTSVYPVIAALTERFKQLYPNVQIQITNVTGSGAGLADANAGKVSFGMRSSVYDGSGDDKSKLNAFQIAMDGVAIVVHKNSSLADISFADIKNAYQVNFGGITAPVSREAGSGTRTCFEDIMKSNGGIPTYAAGTQYLSSTEAIASAVAGNPNSIGYMSLGAVGSNVKKLKVAGVDATEENVLSGTYKFSRPFVLLRQKTKAMSTAEKEFLKFALSVDGQRIINNSNFIPLSAAGITAQLQKAGL